MDEDTDGYVATLADELRATRPDLVRAAEDELQRLRLKFGVVARFINNPAYDLTARTALAEALKLPAPENRRRGD